MRFFAREAKLSMRVAIVLNDSSGGALGRGGLAREVARLLASAGVDAQFFGDEHGDLPGRIEAARAAGDGLVVVGGGDGTIASAAQVLAGTDTALAILPLGTMNLMAKDLAIPLDLEAAVATIASGEIRVVDVGSVNGHVFLCNSVIGVAAVLQRQRERERSMPGMVRWWRLSIAAVKAFTRYRPRRLGVQLGRGMSRLRTRALVVAVNAYDPAALPQLARARLDGGELVLYVVDAVGPLRLLGRVLGWIAGRAAGIGIERHRGARLAVSSRRKRLRVMNDGELRLVSSPLRYRLHRKALRVLVPALVAEPPNVAAEKDVAASFAGASAP